jgi:2-oxoglutarate ferredoxin oxidoreductase subunit gamma
LRRQKKKLKKIEIRISGLGGQGIVLAGQILGRAAVYNGKNAVQTQSYGAEARGSSAKSEVIISDGKIGFPEVRSCDVLVAMSQEAMEENIKDLKDDGILIVDSSATGNIPDAKAKIFKVPAMQTAEKTVGRLYANMVMLGAFTRITRAVNEEAMEKAIKDTFPQKALDQNIEAFRIGSQLASAP